MYINAIGKYIPQKIIGNDVFYRINKLDNEWIIKRTGIEERRRADDGENSNTMGVKAVESVQRTYLGSLSKVDLIVSASYSPYDTVGTIAHCVQKHFNISNAKALTISSGCSSFVNAMEIVECYFSSNKSEIALIIASEHNTMYNEMSNKTHGHLWGDGAAAVILSKTRQSEQDILVEDIITRGYANIGDGPNAVGLKPLFGGIAMPNNKDVFVNACKFMTSISVEILEKNNYNISDIKYLIPHQANIRIIKKVAENLNINDSKIVINIDKMGNTGSASTLIGLYDIYTKIKKDDIILLSVFGGGYSAGSILMKK